MLVDGTWQWVIYVINEPGEAAAWSTLKPNFVETSDICRFVRHGDRGGVEP